MRELVTAGQLVITREQHTRTLVLALYGELDIASAPALEREVLDAEDVGPDRIVIDLSGLQFTDSAGLHAIVRAQQRSHEQQHQLALVHGPRPVHRVFELTGTLDMVSFEDPGGGESSNQADPPKPSANLGEPLSYMASGNVRVLAFQRHAGASAIQTLGERISAIATSEPQPTCVVIDTTGVHGPDGGQLAAGLVENLHTAAQSGIRVAVVSSDAAVYGALHGSEIEHLVIAPTIRQAMQACGTR